MDEARKGQQKAGMVYADGFGAGLRVWSAFRFCYTSCISQGESHLHVCIDTSTSNMRIIRGFSVILLAAVVRPPADLLSTYLLDLRVS